MFKIFCEHLRGFSSAGRAPALQAGGQRFDPANLHQSRKALKNLVIVRLRVNLTKEEAQIRLRLRGFIAQLVRAHA